MNRYISTTLFALFTVLLITSVSSAADCSGTWSVLPHYTPGRGGPCKILGLDSNKGTCQAGQVFETFCDDMSEGRYRTCYGTRRCKSGYPGIQFCSNWDYLYNRPCPEGYTNPDCRDGCEPAQNKGCNNWDFVYNRPCPEGYINYDCKGGCRPVR